MKKSLIILGLTLCLLGCDTQEAKTNNPSIFVQFDEHASQWRGFEVENNAARWFSSTSCEITVSEPLSVSLRNFELDESGDTPIYSHPSLGDFLPIATLDKKSMYAAMKTGNKMKLWGILEYDKIDGCQSFIEPQKYNL